MAPAGPAKPPDMPPDLPAGALAASLLAWYDRHRRSLPWRAPAGAEADPYRVWLSEIMLQQTTVAAVKPYFERFLARFPDVGALAAAPSEAVMQAWAGLGYYSRARNLHACAIAVVRDHGGRFPDSEAGLRGLPGIGPYTAAAVAAIAFDRRAAAVDGNVERVLTRLRAIAVPLPKAKPLVHAEALALVPEDRPGDFAQALMDLGATICTPRRPACVLCPWSAPCCARAAGQAELYPVKAPKAERPARAGAAFVALRGGRELLLRTRPPKGLLGGMAEVPGSAWRAGHDGKAGSDAPLPAAWRRLPVPVRHVFTHFALDLHVHVASLPPGTAVPAGCRFTPLRELGSEPLPSLMRKVVDAGLEALGAAGQAAPSEA